MQSVRLNLLVQHWHHCLCLATSNFLGCHTCLAGQPQVWGRYCCWKQCGRTLLKRKSPPKCIQPHGARIRREQIPSHTSQQFNLKLSHQVKCQAINTSCTMRTHYKWHKRYKTTWNLARLLIDSITQFLTRTDNAVFSTMQISNSE